MTTSRVRSGKATATKLLTAAADSFGRARLQRAAFSLVLALAATSASATTEGIPFVGNITDPNRCAINVLSDGQFGISADFHTLSSKLPGGVGGVADVTSSRPYDITVEALPFFTHFPGGGNTNTTFEARFSGVSIDRGRDFAEQSGSTPVRTRGGTTTTRVTTQLIATRTGSAFPSGNYTGTVVVRCE